jgi:hypothetical protein
MYYYKFVYNFAPLVKWYSMYSAHSSGIDEQTYIIYVYLYSLKNTKFSANYLNRFSFNK